MSDDPDDGRSSVGPESTTDGGPAESDGGPSEGDTVPAESDTGAAESHDATHGDRDAPLGDLAERRRARREERESAETDTDDPFAALGREADVGDHGSATDPDSTAPSEDAFEQMDVEPVDSEDVWADLLDDEPAAGDGAVAQTATVEADETDAAADEVGAAVETETGPTAAGDDADDAGEEADPREEHVIPKADYCQRCAYFSDPPDVACEHEGTDIVSVEDFEHFRVRGCPVVENEFDPDDR